MPELPEVETVRRGLEPLLVGRAIVEGWGHPSPKFASAPFAAGARIDQVGRRGKYLLVGLDDDRQLIVHLGMTGQLRMRPDGMDPYVRAWWVLDDGRVLELRDVRRFGRIGVVPAGEWASLPTLAALGPEPWDPALDDGGLWRNLRRSTAHVKTQLLSQRPIAGIGNIYADEALWRAGVHPSRRSITRRESERLLAELRTVLVQAIANGGTTLRDYRTVDGGQGRNQVELGCYGRAGQPCLRCGTELRRSVVDGRGTTYCPACQRRR
ncbi:MAG TPA: bifunctional DNA-formamidopyrimidine glycosylase/DNA-(apurinic or apyrimidinic site) lyase [Acidimicrobiales bacterium]|nr:bifunctional DNA-formamidopyrimidine glycosylase/DNA-(apurinic or apyrimidinic site) lyase [Acidimicrobiales bacterium]